MIHRRDKRNPFAVRGISPALAELVHEALRNEGNSDRWRWNRLQCKHDQRGSAQLLSGSWLFYAGMSALKEKGVVD